MNSVNKLKGAFRSQVCTARGRGIPFLLTFQQWLQIWQDSGKLHQRGRRINQYCMARFGDVGAYEVGNVQIILHRQNSVDGNIGRQSRLGAILSDETKRKISLASSRPHGRKMSAAHKAAMLSGFRKKFPQKNLASTSCGCGCGNLTKPGNLFLHGHTGKNKSRGTL